MTVRGGTGLLLPWAVWLPFLPLSTSPSLCGDWLPWRAPYWTESAPPLVDSGSPFPVRHPDALSASF